MLVSVFSTRDADTPARHKGKKTNSDNHLRNLLSARLPDIWRKPGAKHCSSLCSQSEGGEYCGGQARAENPTKSCPKALVMFATCSWPSLCEQSELQCWRRNRRLCGPAPLQGRVLKIQKNLCAFFAKQQVAKHAHMINEQSAKRSALKGQPVHSPGQRPGYQRINAYAL